MFLEVCLGNLHFFALPNNFYSSFYKQNVPFVIAKTFSFDAKMFVVHIFNKCIQVKKRTVTSVLLATSIEPSNASIV